MKFEFKEHIPYPRDEVYALLKDGLDKAISFVPNVEKIVELSREDLGNGETKLVNEWYGEPGVAPRIIRPFIKKEFQKWRDYAHWKDNDHLVDWHFKSAVLAGLYDCSGTNYIEDGGAGTTTVRLTGTLTTYPEKVPGVPKALTKRAAPTVEKWVINLVTPNLAEMPKAVKLYLDQEHAKD